MKTPIVPATNPTQETSGATLGATPGMTPESETTLPLISVVTDGENSSPVYYGTAPLPDSD